MTETDGLNAFGLDVSPVAAAAAAPAVAAALGVGGNVTIDESVCAISGNGRGDAGSEFSAARVSEAGFSLLLQRTVVMNRTQ